MGSQIDQPPQVFFYRFVLWFRVNCDFNGVMVNEVIVRTPQLEELGVPLIVSISSSDTYCGSRLLGHSNMKSV